MNWYLEALKKYAVFSGRSRRKEYWYFVLFNLIISFVLGLIDRFLGLTTEYGLGILGGPLQPRGVDSRTCGCRKKAS